MTLADTEYSQALPAGCKRFLIHTRDESEFRVAFIAGLVAAPTNPYLTVLARKVYYEDWLHLPEAVGARTIYFASASALKIIEIVAWTE